MDKAWVVRGRIKYRAKFMVFAQSKEEAEKKARDSQRASEWLADTAPMVDLFPDETVLWVDDGESTRNVDDVIKEAEDFNRKVQAASEKVREVTPAVVGALRKQMDEDALAACTQDVGDKDG